MYTLLGTNISPTKALLKMIFLFPRWDMLVPWRVIILQFRAWHLVFASGGQQYQTVPTSGWGFGGDNWRSLRHLPGGWPHLTVLTPSPYIVLKDVLNQEDPHPMDCFYSSHNCLVHNKTHWCQTTFATEKIDPMMILPNWWSTEKIGFKKWR